MVEVNARATEKARARFGGGIAVGKFLNSIPLYRVLDGEELRTILDTGEIKGGTYSVPGERDFGAQWATDGPQIAKWGDRQRGKRLGHELFVAQIDGKGRVFAHLSGAEGLMQPDSGVVSLDPSFCHGGLGCSLHVGLQGVVQWYVVEPGGGLRKVSRAELEEQAEQAGLQPREVDLHIGALLDTLPKKVTDALRFEIHYAQDSRLDQFERMRKWRTLGIANLKRMDQAALGRLLIKSVCLSEDCGMLKTSLGDAERDAQPSRSDGERRFSVHVALIAHTAVPHHVADLTGQSAKVKYVDIYAPGDQPHWVRIWQPWGQATVHFLENGRVTFR